MRSGKLASLCLACYLTVVPQTSLFSQDVKEIEKELNSELRKAQSAFFNSKFDESGDFLKKAEQLLNDLKKIEPEHKQLKSFEQKIEKQQKDLAKKTKTPTHTPTTIKPSAPPEKPAITPLTKSLPRKTSQEMRELTRTLDSLEHFEKDRMLRLQQGNDPERLESILAEIQKKAASIDELLQKIMEIANEENATDHPTLVATKERAANVFNWVSEEISRTREMAARAGDAQAAAAAAADSLSNLWHKYDSEYFTPLNNLSYENEPEKISEAFKLFAEYEKHKSELNSAVEDFESRYGNSREMIDQANSDNKAGYAWENIKKAMTAIDEIPARLSGRLGAIIDGELNDLAKRHDFFRLAKHTEIRQLDELARRYATDYAGSAGVTDRLSKDMQAFEAKIAERSWPASKGNAADLAGAMEYLQNSWGKDEKHNYTVLGATITGEWSVQKTDLLGRPVMFGLPVLLAVQKPEDKEKNLARIFNLTLRTAESVNARKEPPFASDTVGDSHYIKTDKIAR